MKNSIKEELTNYINGAIEDEIITNDNIDDWHHILFNEDYYIIGYYQCSQWLKNHGIDVFDAINICIQYEKENFGEVYGSYDNSEKVVNMLVYIFGEELLSDIAAETIEDLKNAI